MSTAVTPVPSAGLDVPVASARIRRAALALFRRRGYHGTPVRALARAVRMEAGSLYYHFPSKQDILADLMNHTLDELMDGVRRAIEPATSPAERLRAAVSFHVLFHASRRDEAFVSRSELRSLTPANLRRNMARRDAYEQIFRGLVAEGVAAGVFEVPDGRIATMAILTMCSSITDWYSDRGPLSPEAVADGYAEMALRLAGWRRPADR